VIDRAVVNATPRRPPSRSRRRTARAASMLRHRSRRPNNGGTLARACKWTRLQRYESAPFTGGTGPVNGAIRHFADGRRCLATARPASPRS